MRNHIFVAGVELVLAACGGGGDRIVVDVTDDQGNGKSIELKLPGEGKTEMLLDEYPLSAGDYSWVRLAIDPLKTYVVGDKGGADKRPCVLCRKRKLPCAQKNRPRPVFLCTID